jgi:hypothetical protein
MKTNLKYSGKHLLGQESKTNLDVMYKILKSGYLKPGAQVGEQGVHGFYNEEGMNFIFLMFFDIGMGKNMLKIKKKNKLLRTCRKPNYLLTPELLLDRNSYLNLGWYGVKNNNSIKIKGKEIKNINQKVTELRNIIKKKKINSMYTNEFLIKKKINLKKYLKEITIFLREKPKIPEYLVYYKEEQILYNKIIDILKNKYPNVEVYVKKFYKKKNHCITRKLKL